MTSRALLILAVAWGLGLAIGGYEMYVYETTPGAREAPPAAWPEDSRIARAPGGATVIMFVTASCPCSRASLAELAQVHGAARIYVISDGALPAASPFTWLADDGREAERFAARTSGYVVAYDAAGALVFSGGITGSRGHVGANAGRDLLEAALAGRAPESTHAVFGCELAKAL